MKSVKELRQTTSLSQSQFAKVVDIPRSMINRYENGHTTPSLDNYIKIVEALGFELKLVPRDLSETELLKLVEDLEFE